MADRLLNEKVTRQVKDVFQKQLSKPVKLIFFSQETGCDYCDDTRQLLEEVTALSDKLSLAIYDLDKDAAIARQYQVERAPGLVIAGWDGAQIQDYGIRFAGIPSGYEFSSLIQSLVLVSRGDSGLSQKTRQALQSLKDPIHLLVFATPT